MRRNTAETFWARVDRRGPDDCWEWQGTINQPGGYGRLQFGGRAEYAHRVAFLDANKRWPDQCVCHRCDNPKCCNPSHLFEGSHADNAADRQFKNRHGAVTKPHRVLRGDTHGMAKLSEADVNIIRMLNAMGATQYALADWYGVHRTTIGYAISGKNWKHLS